MTMPHLMNCPHRGNSHCLDCVKRAWEESDQRIRDLEAALEAEKKKLGDAMEAVRVLANECIHHRRERPAYGYGRVLAETNANPLASAAVRGEADQGS